MSKVKGFIQLLVAAGLIALAVWSVVIPDEGRRIEDATYVEDAIVLPENEGERVVVAGKVEVDGPAVDPDLGIEFASPRVIRNVDVLTYDGKWQWRDVSELSITDGLKGASFTGTVGIGQFALDDQLIRDLTGTQRDWTADDIDNEALARLGDSWQLVDTGAQLYLSQVGTFEMEGSADRRWHHTSVGDLEGSLRVRYSLWDAGDDYQATVVGIQRGDTLCYDPDLNALPTFEGYLDADEVVEAQNTSASIGMIVFALIPAALLAFFGVRNLRG